MKPTVHGLFDEQALRTPRAEAVVHGDSSGSYEALDRQAIEIGARLLRAGARPETVVAFVPNGPSR
ncbi:hypothetical protein [Pendulispora albinea]|uniref:AMP-dependent synthetase/ligase domain-containing protein n=1 Tax=Pendulispora albinea TaxID=2741071 RepID=A0ABZ2MBJ7_9BACT